MTTWNQITSLTPQQQTKMEQFRQIGLALINGMLPDISAVNDNQAKSAAQFLGQDLGIMVQATERGVRYVREFYKNQAAQTYEDSVTPGP